MAHIEKRGQGRWRARYRGPDGRERSQTFERRVDAERFLTGVEHSKLVGAYVDPEAGRVTFGGYAEEWLATRVHRPSTQVRVESDLRVHVLPHFGHRPLGSIRHSEIQGWVRGRSAVLAPGTVENAYRTVAAVFRSAVRDHILAVNPCEAIVLPRHATAEVVPPTTDEVQALLAAMPARYRIAGVLAAGAGLRQGEALGVTVDRIDFLRRQLRIDRQLVTPARGQPELAPPKTPASVRVVPLADYVLEALAEHVGAFPSTGTGLLITYVDGRAVRRNRFGAMWRQSTVRADLPTAFRYHDLRHHFASALIAGGCSVKVVQKVLGHASARETLDTYGHLWPDSDDLTRQAIDSVFKSPAASPRPRASQKS